MKITARFILTPLLFAICYLLFAVSPTFAQYQTNPYLNPNTNPDVPKNLHTWTQNVMIEVMSAMTCQLAGIDPTNPEAQCLGVDPNTGNIGYVENGGGAIGMAGKMIAMLYTPPLHTGDYFKYLASNFGIAKQANAATGFEGLKPIQSLWVAFRNIVYLLFVIIFVVIGLAIMLRVRIDPRTVMTIQNQIPKIIIGILLVTFSFAIAGFLIDLMYVVIFLSYEVISQGVPSIDLSKLNPLVLQNATPFTASDGISRNGVFGIAAHSTGQLIFLVNTFLKDLIEEMFTGSSSGIPLIGGLFDWVTGLIVKGLSFVLGGVVAGLVGIIAFLIIAIALLIALIRLWFVLIMAYVGILLNVVFAPFWIAGALLPGSPIGFGAWLRSIVANLAAFPAVIVMFLLAKAFIEGFGEKPSDTAFVPPLIGDFTGTDVIGSLIGLGIILMTPNVVALVKAALKAPSLPTSSIAAIIAGGTRVVTSTVSGGIAARMASQEYIPDPNAHGGFRRRGPTGAIFGRLFGR